MTFTGTGSIWDEKKNKKLCRFNAHGLLTTDDPYVVQRLLEKGYSEVKSEELVSIYECNSVNVDWKEKHDAVLAEKQEWQKKYIAMEKAYKEVEARLHDIQENMDIPVEADTAENAVGHNMEDIEDGYVLGDDIIPHDIESLSVVKLKSILKKHDALDGKDYRKVTKQDAVMLMAKLLHEKGLD